jgi:hypothetical protein
VNDKPLITPIADQVVSEDGTSGAVPFTISDRDTPAANLALIASSSNPSLISTSGIALGGTGSNRTVQLTPLPNQFGSAVITISATDSNNLSGTRSFLLIVPAVNDPPTLDAISDVVLNEANPSAIVNLAGISSGATNEIQTLTVTATSSNPNMVPNPVVNYTSPNGTGSLNVSKAPGAFGSAVITVRVNDNQSQNNLITRTFSVTVTSIQPTISGMTRDGTGSSIRLQSFSGVVYVLEATESLDVPAWLPVDSRTGTGGEIVLIDSGPAVLQKFYRVRVQ